MNIKFQKEFLNRKDLSTLEYNIYKVDNFRVNRYDCVYDSLMGFCKKHKNDKIVILSKWCRKVKGLKIEAAFRSLVALKILSHTHSFRDEDYLKPHGKFLDVLITLNDLHTVAEFFDVTKNESREALTKGNALFSLQKYEEYIFKRKKIRAKECSKDENYFKDISFECVSYYNKEYVSNHKYASDFLQSFVENNKKNITDGEKAAMCVLEEICIEYEFQKPCLVFGHSYIMDFYLPKHGVCIEIDGGYHDTQNQLLKDREKTNMLAKSGVLTVRFTNEEAQNGNGLITFLNNLLNKTNNYDKRRD